MKRALFVIGVSYFVTTWLAFLCGGEFALKLSLAALLTGILLLLMSRKTRSIHAASIIMLTAAVAFSSFWLYNERELKPIQAIAGRTVEVEGLITGVNRGPSSVSYTMTAGFPEYPALGKNVPLLLREIGGGEHEEGEVIRCTASFKPAPETLWYKSRGIYLTGQNIRDAERIPAGGHRYERAAVRLRTILSRNVYARLGNENADIITAMTLGLTSDIPPETYNAVARAGTSHLLSVSGLHLSILSAFVLYVLNSLKCPGRLAGVITIFVSLAFVTVVGFGASATRAFVMTAITLSGGIVSRRSDSMTSLGVALIICSVIWPYWTLSWSLWLSAGATLGIIMFGGRISGTLYARVKSKSRMTGRLVKPVVDALGMSLAAYVFTVPVLLMMSGWISLIAPLANILTLPFVPVAILGGICCAIMPDIPVLTEVIALVTDFSTRAIIRISEVLSASPFAIIALDESYLLLWMALVALMTAVIIIYRGKTLVNKHLIIYASALAVLSFSVGELSNNIANKGKLELVTFSGRNAAVLLREQEAVILGTPDAYEITNLLRYLNFRGVQAVPAIIAADSGDRAGSGMLRLVGSYPTDCIIAPDDAYIVDMLKEAVPDSLVYAGGYAEITVLGGAKITTDLHDRSIYISIGNNQIEKIRKECDIIESKDGVIRIFDDGILVLPRETPPDFSPVGAHLFGESRVLLNTR